MRLILLRRSSTRRLETTLKSILRQEHLTEDDLQTIRYLRDSWSFGFRQIQPQLSSITRDVEVSNSGMDLPSKESAIAQMSQEAMRAKRYINGTVVLMSANSSGVTRFVAVPVTCSTYLSVAFLSLTGLAPLQTNNAIRPSVDGRRRRAQRLGIRFHSGLLTV